MPTHFDLKQRFGLPDAVVSAATLTFLEPVRPGDVMTMGETVRSVSDEKHTSVGTGRFWVIDVDYANQRGEAVGIETITGFGHHGRAPSASPPTSSPPSSQTSIVPARAPNW